MVETTKVGLLQDIEVLGTKKKYRIIDFKRNKFEMAAEIKRFEHDPFRSANIMLVEYEDKTIAYNSTAVHT